MNVAMKGIALAVGAIAALPAPALARCTVIDLETPLERLAAQTAGSPMPQRVAAYRGEIVAKYHDVYAPSVFGAPDQEHLDRGLDRALQRSLGGATDPRRPRMLRRVRSSLDGIERAFRRTFPKFSCTFPIYAMDSFGSFDGAGRIVGGRPALVFGIDQLVAEQDVLSLPVFLSHEFFHRYHGQRAGFSDDPGEHQAIWRALWAEGLATYISYRLTPGATVADVLMLPRDLATQVDPRLPTLAGDLLAHLDQVDPKTFGPYFTYGGKDGPSQGIPWRAGYYIGFLVAQDIGRTHSLAELPDLAGAPLHDAIAASLRRFASGATRADP